MAAAKKKPSYKADMAMDKKKGIKEMSAADKKIDAKKGFVPFAKKK